METPRHLHQVVDIRVDGVCEGRLYCGGSMMEVGSVQICSWHFDSRDGELMRGTAARM